MYSRTIVNKENPTYIDNTHMKAVLSSEDVAQFLGKSVSWVYKHWQELGGKKIGGSIFFPERETLHEQLFRKREGVEVRLHQKGTAVHEPVVPNQKGCKPSRGKKEGRDTKPRPVTRTDHGGDTNRHNLFGVS